MLAALMITFPHFSVLSAMSIGIISDEYSNSVGDVGKGSHRGRITGLAGVAWISVELAKMSGVLCGPRGRTKLIGS
jgi:hypothetical protein